MVRPIACTTVAGSRLCEPILSRMISCAGEFAGEEVDALCFLLPGMAPAPWSSLDSLSDDIEGAGRMALRDWDSGRGLLGF